MILPLPFIKLIGSLAKFKTGILLSGGMDSVALTYWKRPSHAFSIDYGQKPAIAEIQAAKQVCRHLGIDHHIIQVDCSSLGSGDLSGQSSLSISPCSEWWPYRNQLILTLAAMKAVSFGIEELIIGSVKTDDVHKDGTNTFFELMSEILRYQEGNISILAPAIDLTTQELIKESHIPVSVLLWSHSCQTSNIPCMNCNGCKKYLFNIQQLDLD